MSSIGGGNNPSRPTGGIDPETVAQVQEQLNQIGENAGTENPRLTTRIDTTDRVVTDLGRPATAQDAAVLEPPTVPEATLETESVSSARTFAVSLKDVNSSSSSEAMMLAFLKLQMLDSSLNNYGMGLATEGRGQLMGAAVNSMNALAAQSRNNAGIKNQASQLDSQADAAYADASDTLQQGGVNPSDLNKYQNTATSTEDLVSQYKADHPNASPEQLDAIRAAGPDLQRASNLNDQAESLWGKVGGTDGHLALAIAATYSTRAGTIGYDSLLKVQEANLESLNDLMALLSGQRADKRGRADSIVDMDKARIQVANLVLALIDKNTAAGMTRNSNIIG